MSEKHFSKISVIIPCKGHATELRNCLSGLSRMVEDVPSEVIVVDSHSDPKVLATVHDFPEIKIIRSNLKLTAGPARNFGAKQSAGSYLAFLDADCIPADSWLKAAYDEMEKGARMVGGPVIDELPSHPIAAADNLLQFADLGPGRPFGIAELLPGCNLAVRKEVFWGLNGFPDSPPIEDSLFTAAVYSCWPGFCRFVPEMRVAHKGRITLNGFWHHQKKFGYARGVYGFRVKTHQQELASKLIFLPLVILKRMIYVFNRTHRWNSDFLIRNYFLLPIIALGQLSWAIGFRHGCRIAISNRKLHDTYLAGF
jgi:glycosyltransferase involved in cell wall biosynthesis